MGELHDSQLHELCAALGWQGGTYHQVLAAILTLGAERDEFRALLEEWDGGEYDGSDYLRRVRLALHGDKGMRRVK